MWSEQGIGLTRGVAACLLEPAKAVNLVTGRHENEGDQHGPPA